jgi:uncharacterized protein
MSDTGKPTPTRFAGYVPQRFAIDAYGNGGFRFGDMSHRGSLLILSDGMHIWAADADTPPTDELLRAVLARLAAPEFLLLGTGRRQVFPTPAARAAFAAAGIGLETMDTGAACRTYNVLLAEKRPVMAALVAVA